MVSPHKPRILGLVLVAVSVGLYWQTTHQDFAVIDDDDYVSGNPRVKEGLSWEAAKMGLYHVPRGELAPADLAFPPSGLVYSRVSSPGATI